MGIPMFVRCMAFFSFYFLFVLNLNVIISIQGYLFTYSRVYI